MLGFLHAERRRRGSRSRRGRWSWNRSGILICRIQGLLHSGELRLRPRYALRSGLLKQGARLLQIFGHALAFCIGQAKELSATAVASIGACLPPARRFGRHEAAYLRHDDDERDLTKVGRLTGHIRPGYDHHAAPIPVEATIVRDERSRVQAHLDNWMPAGDDVDRVAVFQRRATVAVIRRDLGQRSKDVEAGDRVREAAQSVA